jgi:hypothetical protein
MPASRLQWGRLPLNRASGPLVLATGGLAFLGDGFSLSAASMFGRSSLRWRVGVSWYRLRR